jgi:pimeloyl-ACP methyl ester carboxylesterase
VTWSVGPDAPGDDLWVEWGGQGPVLHLAHGNGFPPQTYRRVAEGLTMRFRVVGMAARPLRATERPELLTDWWSLAHDLRRELGARRLQGVVGVGHSLGGVVSALAAVEDPALFSALVLVDPVLFTGFLSVLGRVMKRVGVARRLPLVRQTRRRRETWADRETARGGWARAARFARWRPEVLDDYVRAGTVECAGGGVRLRYPREWEARVFEVAPHDLWSHLRRLTVPTVFVRGADSTTFLPGAAARAAREVPGARVVEVPGATHFVPMERPDELAQLILDVLP